MTSVDYYHFLQTQAAERPAEGGGGEQQGGRVGGGMCVAREGHRSRRVCIKLSSEAPVFTQSRSGTWLEGCVGWRAGGVHGERSCDGRVRERGQDMQDG